MTYMTRVTMVSLEGKEYPAIEIPAGLLEELQLVEGEILEWEIDPETNEVSFRKKNMIIND